MGLVYRQPPNIGNECQAMQANQYVSGGTSGANGVTTLQISPAKSGSAVGDYLDTVVIGVVSSSTAIGNVKIFDGTTTVFAMGKQTAGNSLGTQAFYIGLEATSTKGFNITASSLTYVTVIGRFDH